MSTETARGATLVTVLTAEGRSAIAVVVVAGPNAVSAVDQHFQAANGRPLHQQSLGRIVYGQWGEGIGEDLVVCRRDPSTVEVHCHGGAASIAQVVSHLTAAGCEPTDWRHWLADQTEDLLVCEAHTALADASTLRTATILLDQYHGALRCEVTEIGQVLSSGAVELGRDKLRDLLRYAELGRHLTQPWRVVIAGLPNVGKSSLINAIVGYQRAIVFDRPGTTRDVVSATTAIEGWPVKLSDTAGLHPTADELECAGIALAHVQLAEADLVVWVLDAVTVETQTTASLDELVGQQFELAGVDINRSSLVVVVNKIDLFHSQASFEESTIAISALKGTGLDGLFEAIACSLVPQSPAAGAAVPFTQRQVLLLEQAVERCEQGQSNQAAALAPISKLLS